MKIAVLSDFHFGFGLGSVVETDSFENAEEAIEESLECDLIIILGDIFDARAPKTKTWAMGIKILTKPFLKENSGVRVVKSSKQLLPVSKITLSHIPVIGLHGNHERTARGEFSPIQALENAGILIYLHTDYIIFEKDGVKVAIHGMSNVPERFAKDVLYKWNPKPIPNCFNILLLHQNIFPYVYSPIEQPSLSLSDLPKGFDLILDGHIHNFATEKIENTTLIICGSTAITQFAIPQSEAKSEKGFVKINIENDGVKIDFLPLKGSRKFFYEEMDLKENLPVVEQIENKINEILRFHALKKPPLIKIKIKGSITQVSDKELRMIEKKYSDKAIIIFVKELESPEITGKIEFLRSLKEQRLSVEEIGIRVFRETLSEFGFEHSFNYEEVFKLLADGNVDNVFNILTGEQKTLPQIFS
jgi:DNA repair exonuclease SbcCD nuclease subunit